MDYSLDERRAYAIAKAAAEVVPYVPDVRNVTVTPVHYTKAWDKEGWVEV